ncbi:hypothetical protein COCMIDRAFT_89923, partial [Bipolaris oryzae ATCC 44560]
RQLSKVLSFYISKPSQRDQENSLEAYGICVTYTGAASIRRFRTRESSERYRQLGSFHSWESGLHTRRSSKPPTIAFDKELEKGVYVDVLHIKENISNG